IRRALIDPAAVEALETEQATRFAQARQSLAGTAFLIHPESASLRIQDALSGELLARHALASSGHVFDGNEAPELPVASWDCWGTALCHVNRQSGAIEQVNRLGPDSPYGLVVTEHSSLLYTPNPLQANLLAESYQCL